jgi:hypothetical protein
MKSYLISTVLSCLFILQPFTTTALSFHSDPIYIGLSNFNEKLLLAEEMQIFIQNNERKRTNEIRCFITPQLNLEERKEIIKEFGIIPAAEMLDLSLHCLALRHFNDQVDSPLMIRAFASVPQNERKYFLYEAKKFIIDKGIDNFNEALIAFRPFCFLPYSILSYIKELQGDNVYLHIVGQLKNIAVDKLHYVIINAGLLYNPGESIFDHMAIIQKLSCLNIEKLQNIDASILNLTKYGFYKHDKMGLIEIINTLTKREQQKLIQFIDAIYIISPLAIDCFKNSTRHQMIYLAKNISKILDENRDALAQHFVRLLQGISDKDRICDLFSVIWKVDSEELLDFISLLSSDYINSSKIIHKIKILTTFLYDASNHEQLFLNQKTCIHLVYILLKNKNYLELRILKNIIVFLSKHASSHLELGRIFDIFEYTAEADLPDLLRILNNFMVFLNSESNVAGLARTLAQLDTDMRSFFSASLNIVLSALNNEEESNKMIASLSRLSVDECIDLCTKMDDAIQSNNFDEFHLLSRHALHPEIWNEDGSFNEDAENTMDAKKQELVKSSLEIIYKLTEGVDLDAEKAVIDVLTLIAAFLSDDDAKQRFTRKYTGESELENAIRTINGERQPQDYDGNIMDDELYIKLEDGTQATIKDMFARVWYLVNNYMPKDESRADRERILLRENFITNLGQCVDEKDNQRVCNIGKAQRFCSVLQGYYDGVKVDDVEAPDPDLFFNTFLKEEMAALEKLSNENPLKLFIFTFDKGDLDVEAFSDWLEQFTQKFIEASDITYKFYPRIKASLESKIHDEIKSWQQRFSYSI